MYFHTGLVVFKYHRSCNDHSMLVTIEILEIISFEQLLKNDFNVRDYEISRCSKPVRYIGSLTPQLRVISIHTKEISGNQILYTLCLHKCYHPSCRRSSNTRLIF